MTAPQRDPRYGKRRWRETSLIVRNRAGFRCWVPGCERRATVADHIVPVSSGLSDFEFHHLSNLRASCHKHNTVRGMVERFERETAGVEPAPTRGFRPVARYGTPRIR